MLSTPITNIDLFELWRRMLVVVCGMYTLVRTGQSVWHVYGLFWGQDQRIWSIARRYVIAQMLRTRLRRFAWEGLQIFALALAFAAVLFAHRWL